jgi:hypothetical protein
MRRVKESLMPAWYVHMEAARQIAERLRLGEIPPGFPIGDDEARDLGEICHTCAIIWLSGRSARIFSI